MRLRIRGPGGATTVTLDDEATVGDLVGRIAEITSFPNFDVKYGYPPRPLILEQSSTPVSSLGVRLDGEQLTITPKDDVKATESAESVGQFSTSITVIESQVSKTNAPAFSFAGIPDNTNEAQGTFTKQPAAPITLSRKKTATEAPEVPLPDRGATLVLRVMPDDNSCLFRAFGTAVLPGDDQSMTELRSLVASTIQEESDVYNKAILEQEPDDYCKWIQTEDAWGGGIELSILSKHFDIEICSIDVQSLRVDTFNDGRPTRCILVYSGIHYDIIVQSPSDFPHTASHSPPEFDQRVWDTEDNYILIRARELCKKLQAQHYYTDTGGMAIKCNVCGWIGNGQSQASQHAQQTGHYDMAETNI